MIQIPDKKKSRPNVAKFEKYNDREYIRKAGIELNKKQNGFAIREHFPHEIEDRRKSLYPIAQNLAKDESNRVVLVRDKLYVNGEWFTIQNNQGTANANTNTNKIQSVPHCNDNDSYKRSYITGNLGQQGPLGAWDRRYVRPKQIRSRSGQFPQPGMQDVGNLFVTTNPFEPLQKTAKHPIIKLANRRRDHHLGKRPI